MSIILRDSSFPVPKISRDEVLRLAPSAKFVFVRGFAGDLIDKQVGYYNKLVRSILDDKALNVSQENILFAKTKQFGRCDTNARLLSEFLNGKTRENDILFLFGHSHACNYILKLFIDDEKITKRIKVCVFMQAAFYGTPFGDFKYLPLFGPPLYFVANNVFRCIGAENHMIADLSTRTRKKFMEEHKSILTERTQHIRILPCTSTSISYGRYVPKLSFTYFWSVLLIVPRFLLYALTGEANDGLLTLSSQKYYGTSIHYNDVDHVEMIANKPPQGFVKQLLSRT